MVLSLVCCVLYLALLSTSNAFVVHQSSTGTSKTYSSRVCKTQIALFEDDEEIIPVAENYVHSKYKESAEIHGHKYCTKDDAKEVLRSILPPVTPAELDEEVTRTLSIIMENPANTDDKIEEGDFVKAIMQNSYWEEAGDLVVKELMYFDSLHHYYRTGYSLLKNDDFDELKDNLSWEGSSIASMNKEEALFVSAVAASRRGDSIMDDDEYVALKSSLQDQGSWVVARGQDALEHLGLDTFIGYLHRALK